MAENIRKEIEKELKSLQSKVSSFSNAVDIVNAAQEVAGKSGELLDNVYKSNSEFFKDSTKKLRDLLVEQETLFSNLNTASTGLTAIASKIEKDDLSGKVTILKKDIQDQHKVILEVDKKLTSQVKSIQESFAQLTTFNEQQFQSLKVQQSSHFQDLVSKLTASSNEALSRHTETLKLIKDSRIATTTHIDTRFSDLKSQNQLVSDKVSRNNKLIVTFSVIIILLQIVMLVGSYLKVV